MPEVFVDTSGWAALLVASEPLHDAADSLMRRWRHDGSHLVTSNYVLAELVALLTSPLRVPRAQQIDAIDAIRAASWIEILHIDRALEEEAWDLLKARPDKTWSLVDCTSFIIMGHRGIREALTADRHFEQAGFLRALA